MNVSFLLGPFVLLFLYYLISFKQDFVFFLPYETSKQCAVYIGNDANHREKCTVRKKPICVQHRSTII